jgi:hypothetical protein
MGRLPDPVGVYRYALAERHQPPTQIIERRPSLP